MYTFSANIEKKKKKKQKHCLAEQSIHQKMPRYRQKTQFYHTVISVYLRYRMVLFLFFFLFHILMTKTGLLASSCSPLPYRESTLSESTKEECFICHYLGMVGKSPTWSVYATSVFTSVSRR